jgi:hypothetical protein
MARHLQLRETHDPENAMTAMPAETQGGPAWHSAFGGDQLPVIDEMVRSLETMTVAGQRRVDIVVRTLAGMP